MIEGINYPQDDITHMDEKVIETFYEFLKKKDRIMVLYGGAGSGKCLMCGTEIVMADGRLRCVEDITTGDEVMGIDSTPRTVLETHRGFGQLYRVKQRRGMDYVVNGEHLLALKRSAWARNAKGEYYPKTGRYRRPMGRYPSWGDYPNISINDYLEQSNKWKRNFYGHRGSIDFDEKEVSIDPYFLGLWLGDGNSDTTAITTMDEKIVESVYKTAERYGMHVTTSTKPNNKATWYRITNGNCGGMVEPKNPLLNDLRKYNLIKNKHIPDEYLYNSRGVRLQILAGLIDTDGSLCSNRGCYEITQKNKRLAEQIYYLASSLGFYVSITKKVCTIKNIGFKGDYYRLMMCGHIEEIPVHIERKKYTPAEGRNDDKISGIKVELDGEGEYFGFEIDGDHKFFLKDFTVLHNSYATSQHFCRMLYEKENTIMFIIRKTLPALRITAWPLVRDMLDRWGQGYNVNLSELKLTHGSNEIQFKSLDDPEKLKSLYNPNYIWVEEATDITYNDFLQLNLRLRTTPDDQIFLTFNPISAYHWLITQVVEGTRKDIAVHHSTYLDNPFLPEIYVQELKELEFIDENFYRVYTLGRPGVLKNIIYSNYIIGEFPSPPIDAYGLDFGMNHPTALIAAKYINGKMYLREELYSSGMTNNDLIKWMESNLPNKNIPIYADDAQSERIEDISRAGFNIHPAKKGRVSAGIDKMRSQSLIIDPDSVNLIKEIRNYKYKETKDGIVLDEPVKYKDDAVDASRYVITNMKVDRTVIPLDLAVPQQDDFPFSDGGGFKW